MNLTGAEGALAPQFWGQGTFSVCVLCAEPSVGMVRISYV